ncbi:MAG: hypothetical protein J6M02_07265 [Clostridia bacterium]|nr:hypothetical protein [Clostridia bacterium]
MKENINVQKQKALDLLNGYMKGEIDLSEIDVDTKKLILQLCTAQLERVQQKIETTEKQIGLMKEFLAE